MPTSAVRFRRVHGGAGLLRVVKASASPPVLVTCGRVVVFLQSEDQGSQFVVFARMWNVAGDEPVNEGGCLSLPFGGVQVGGILHPPQAVDVWGATKSGSALKAFIILYIDMYLALS